MNLQTALNEMMRAANEIKGTIPADAMVRSGRKTRHEVIDENLSSVSEYLISDETVMSDYMRNERVSQFNNDMEHLLNLYNKHSKS